MKRSPLVVLWVVAPVALAPVASSAQVVETAEPAGSVAESPASGEPVEAEPTAPFDAAAAVEEYLGRLTPEEKERSDSYFEGGYWIQLFGFLYGLVVARRPRAR